MSALLVILALGALPPEVVLEATPAKNDDGHHIQLDWDVTAPDGFVNVVFRTTPAEAEMFPGLPDQYPELPKAGEPINDTWTAVYVGFADTEYTDEVSADGSYVYALQVVRTSDGEASEPRLSKSVAPDAALFNTDHWFYLLLVGLTGVAFWIWFLIAKKHGDKLFIRRIAGIDAIEDAIGRSTEMGRPVLYVTGVEDMQDIQTLASILILGHVAKTVAEYDTDLRVCNAYPMTMIVAEEVVRQGYANAGRLDAHRPENVMFLTAEQFAFAAAVTGIIMRDKPATNIYFGRFYAESLLLAETGYLTGAVQIAGTSEFTQLPFFIAACDYALLGEELYAVGAYLSREPTLLAQLKAGDVVKAFIMLLIVAGTLTATFQHFNLGAWLMP